MFYDFIEVSLTMMCNNPNDHQRKLLQETLSKEEKRAAFFAALSAYGECAENYHDPLGEISNFNELKYQKKWKTKSKSKMWKKRSAP